MTRDIYQEVTDKIIAQLEAGVVPWIKPWSANGDDRPHNAISGKPYNGINQILLWKPAGSVGDGWMTFKQALDVGACVRKGEKGSLVVFFKNWTLKDKNSDDGTTKTVPVIRNFTVFHTSQIDNLPEKYLPKPAAELPEVERIERADVLLRQAIVEHGGAQAFYRPSTDSIQLPHAATFNTIGDYYATALHELTHWTGHASRCDRDFSKVARFGDSHYAREELVAEMGAAFLLAHCQIEGNMQHASYLASWLKVLRQDKKAIVNAASKAQQAADFIMQVKKVVEQEEEELIAA